MAKPTFGCTFQLASSAITGSTGKLTEVTAVGFPNLKVGKIDVTHHESAGKIAEYLPDIIDTDEMEIDLNVTPGSTTDLACRAAVLAMSAGVLYYWKLNVPGASATVVFSGQCVVIAYKIDKAPVNGVFKASVTIQPSSTTTQA